jgi:hypothetical protein
VAEETNLKGLVVVCIDANGIPPFIRPLVQGKVYIIRQSWIDHGVAGVLLETLYNSARTTYGGEAGYKLARFRPFTPDQDLLVLELKEAMKSGVKILSDMPG